MNIFIRLLMERLAKKGIDPTSIPAFIRNVANTIASDASISLMKLNKKMEALGWDGIELDAYSLDLIFAIFDSDNDVDFNESVSRLH